LIAAGSPHLLKSRIGGDRGDVLVNAAAPLPAAAAVVASACGAEADIDHDARRVSAPARERMAVMTAVLGGLTTAGVEPEDIAIRRPTLDDVFMELTGHRTDATAPPPITIGTEKEAAA